MAEDLNISTSSKEEAFQTLLPQLRSLVSGEPNIIANLANMASAIKMTFDHLWVGFYIVENEELVLGPFQGPIACTRIAKGKGICGTSWEQAETLIVKDVTQFDGHIACSSESNSEIVVPIYTKGGGIFGVLDVDSHQLNSFDVTDKHYFEQIARLITDSIA